MHSYFVNEPSPHLISPRLVSSHLSSTKELYDALFGWEILRLACVIVCYNKVNRKESILDHELSSWSRKQRGRLAGACRIVPGEISLHRSSDPRDPDATLRRESLYKYFFKHGRKLRQGVQWRAVILRRNRRFQAYSSNTVSFQFTLFQPYCLHVAAQWGNFTIPCRPWQFTVLTFQSNVWQTCVYCQIVQQNEPNGRQASSICRWNCRRRAEKKWVRAVWNFHSLYRLLTNRSAAAIAWEASSQQSQ